MRKALFFLVLSLVSSGFGFAQSDLSSAPETSLDDHKELAPSATLTVTKTADTNDGVCDADCSLREAVAAAASGDTIAFASPLFDTAQTVQLNGQITITKHLTINGRGPTLTTLRNIAPVGPTSRVLVNTASVVNLSGLTITGGNAIATDFANGCGLACGGGIYNAGTMSLSNCVVSGNRTDGSSSFGGGIFNVFGTLTITNSTVSSNSLSGSSTDKRGGGIYNEQGTVNLTNSTVSDNSVTGIGINYGGGLFSLRGTVNLMNTTFSGNSASGDSVASGGGLYVDRVTANITNSTFSGNSVNSGSFAFGGGITIVGAAAVTRVRNSIISANTAPVSPNINAVLTVSDSNIIGDEANVNLAPFGNYGGTMQTYVLRPGSTAINAGNNCVTTLNGCPDFNTPVALTTDQRGSARIAGGAVDVGATESPLSLVVTTTADSGPGSLRQILQTAASTPQDENISFNIPANDPNCTPGVGGDVPSCRVTLTSGAIAIPTFTTAGSVFIQFLAPPTVRLTVSGNNASRVFSIASGGSVFMRNISATAGRFAAVSNAFGGAIYNDGTLTMTDGSVTASTLAATSVTNGGGGIYTSGPLTLIRMTVSGNTITGSTSQRFGGGLMVNGGTTTLANCTFTSNTGHIGGGIAIRNGGVQATNVTITGNFASNNGGGSSGGFLARNVIISGNNSNGVDRNLAGLLSGDSNIVGNEAAVRLGPLGNQGGPTLTHAILSGSTALDSGNNCVLNQSCATFNAPIPLTTDQRGAARVGNVDIGAFEANSSANGGNFRATLPRGSVNAPYNFTLVPNNGTTTYAVTGGNLPPGMNLTTTFAPSAVVALTGTPTFGGIYNFTVTATNGANTNVTDYSIEVLTPTSAGVSVSGRVLTGDGRGLRNATVVLTDAGGVSRSFRTTTFGSFRFDDVAAGEAYVVSVNSKQFTFAPQVVYVGDSVGDLVLIGDGKF